jgi:hypothetical protein
VLEANTFPHWRRVRQEEAEVEGSQVVGKGKGERIPKDVGGRVDILVLGRDEVVAGGAIVPFGSSFWE